VGTRARRAWGRRGGGQSLWEKKSCESTASGQTLKESAAPTASLFCCADRKQKDWSERAVHVHFTATQALTVWCVVSSSKWGWCGMERAGHRGPRARPPPLSPGSHWPSRARSVLPGPAVARHSPSHCPRSAARLGRRRVHAPAVRPGQCGVRRWSGIPQSFGGRRRGGEKSERRVGAARSRLVPNFARPPRLLSPASPHTYTYLRVQASPLHPPAKVPGAGDGAAPRQFFFS
jgi:hypothetical protein